MSVEFGKDWDAITKRRRGKFGTDVRIRTPEEQRIESSLTRPVTLSFENAPLKQVITHIATIADVNVVLDESGLADESLTISTPVSIDVQGIQLKNALVLLLEPLNMGYTIKNEVLKITSEQRLQGQAVVVTYSVADLVVNIQPGQPNTINFGGRNRPQHGRWANERAVHRWLARRTIPDQQSRKLQPVELQLYSELAK